MARKKVKLPIGVLFLSLFALAVIIYFLPHRYTNNINLLYTNIFSRILNLGSKRPMPFFEPSSFEPAGREQNVVSRKEYNKLWSAYANLRADLITLQKRYEKLAGLRSGLPTKGPALCLAEIRKITVTPTGHFVYINKGVNDGVRQGQYVLADNGIIGIISDISDNSAKIRLMTDPNFKMEIRIWKPEENGYISGQLVGRGGNTAKIPLISREYDVKEGDTVYAATKPGFLDTPVVIGRVKSVKPDDEKPLLLDIRVSPVYNLEELEEASIAVIVNQEINY
jgi:rod shape-determining protein MreC